MSDRLTKNQVVPSHAQRSGADFVRVMLVILFAVLQPLSSLLANLLPGDQATTGEVSDRYSHVLTPAGYTFAIWGLIYVASLGLAVYQALPSQHTRAVHRATGWWLAAAFAASTIWVPIWVSGALTVAQLVIITLVVCLAVALGRLTGMGPASTQAEQWLLRLPVSGYLGWATIATVAGAGTTAEWSGISLSDGATTAAAVVALLILAALGAWIASRVLAATGFVLLLAGPGGCGCGHAASSRRRCRVIRGVPADRRDRRAGQSIGTSGSGTPRVGARSIGPPFARSG